MIRLIIKKISNCDKNDNMNSKKKSYLLTLSFVRVCVVCELSVRV